MSSLSNPLLNTYLNSRDEDKENATVHQTQSTGQPADQSFSRSARTVSKSKAIHHIWDRNHSPYWPTGLNSNQSSADMHGSIGSLLTKRSQAAQSQEQPEDDSDDSFSSVTDPFAEASVSVDRTVCPDSAEIYRLKKELEIAHQRMARMDIQLNRERLERKALAEMDLNQSHIALKTVEAAIGSPMSMAQPIHSHRGIDATSDEIGSINQINQWRTARNFMSSTHSMNKQFETPEFAYAQYQPFNQNFDASFQRRHPSPAQTGLNLSGPMSTPELATGLARDATRRAHTIVDTKHSHIVPISHEAISPWTMSQSLNMGPVAGEPLNYRRLLDRDMSCDWQLIVNKIVCSNDQQASIFLQQKLKQGTSEQKFEIVQAIIDQAYPLMINRFGNFLVQRCFEHGTPEQVVAIAQSIQGNTLSLSMDAFGCHVIQKAFDCVPEKYKAAMVNELLRCIPETVIHRYACHVWQKLFELRWEESPPQIMKYVNEALRGMWHQVALGETGSLVVQNIFENCLEEHKRPCIEEVLNNIDIVAHGQFGNWCIQHICEHGAASDRARAIDHVIAFAGEYSTDQFASKVVEKCLKVAGTDFLDRYLARVCEAHSDRPRMPLIDVAGDQFGNYLIQYILGNADAARREVVANHIRKHLVSLRGSKYGSRVAILCCNPSYGSRQHPPNIASHARFSSRFNESCSNEPTTGHVPEGFESSTRVNRGVYTHPFR